MLHLCRISQVTLSVPKDETLDEKNIKITNTKECKAAAKYGRRQKYNDIGFVHSTQTKKL